jgi:hypothetical protein
VTTSIIIIIIMRGASSDSMSDCIVFNWAAARGSAISAEADKTLVSEKHSEEYVCGGLNVCVAFRGLAHLKSIFDFSEGADLADELH